MQHNGNNLPSSPNMPPQSSTTNNNNQNGNINLNAVLSNLMTMLQQNNSTSTSSPPINSNNITNSIPTYNGSPNNFNNSVSSISNFLASNNQVINNSSVNNNTIINNMPQTFISKSNTMSSSVKQFFNNPTLSDVTFIIQGKKFHAHKLVLCARSSYFHHLILIKCKNTSTLEIEIQDASADIFYNILEFVYTDSTTLRSEKIWELYQAAKFYQLNALLLQCQEFIVSTLCDQNVFQQWSRAQNFEASVPLKFLQLYHTINNSTNPEIILSALASQQLQQQQVNVPPTIQTVNNQQPSPKVGNNNSSDIYGSLNNFTFPKKETPTPNSNSNGSSEQLLQTYKFPPPKKEPSPTNQKQQPTFIAPNPVVQQPQEERKEVTQTFELWDENNVPPAAFPSKHAMASFPSFFKVEKNESVPSSSNEKNDPEKKYMYRRLSVMRQDINSIGVFFQHIISAITRLLNAERTTLFMYDKATDELISQVSIGEEEIRIPSDKGIAGTCFTSGKSINVSDAYSNSTFSSEVDKSTGFSTKTVICAPITGKANHIVGVLEALNKHSGFFTDKDEQHLNTICEILSIFVQEQGLDEMKNVTKSTILLHPSAYRRKSTLPGILSNINLDRKLSNRTFSVDETFSLLFDEGEFNFDILNNTNNEEANTVNDNVNAGTVDALWNYLNQSQENLMSTFMSVDQNNQIPQTQNLTLPHNQNQTAATSTLNSQPFIPPNNPPPNNENASTSDTVSENNEKKRKRQQQQPPSGTGMPFMHFRIPRYELQFIQFDGNGAKSKKKK
ncbi:hypothetical protein ABK040_006658 [Willaertia magna]